MNTQNPDPGLEALRQDLLEVPGVESVIVAMRLPDYRFADVLVSGRNPKGRHVFPWSAEIDEAFLSDPAARRSFVQMLERRLQSGEEVYT